MKTNEIEGLYYCDDDDNLLIYRSQENDFYCTECSKSIKIKIVKIGGSSLRQEPDQSI